MESVLTNRLSNEYINSLPIIKFDGEVIVVSEERHAEEVIRELLMESFVGFDTESKPSFTKGTIYPVSLIQLATRYRAYLFQLKKTGFPDVLIRFLEDENIKKIGVGISNDLAKLQEQKPFNAGGFIDLSKLAAAKGIIQVGIRGLTARYMGGRLTKGAQKTNWAQSVLTPKQQIYAASDAWVCLSIYPLLLADPTDYRQYNQTETITAK
ncbi:MAG: 3'-5' exonuclease [Candidatus Omnitrophota bacterium]